MIVFIVGEEPTRGIHRKQFENAVAWIEALQTHGTKSPPVTILGPTFSGSLPSLNELVSADKLASRFNGGKELAIYTGSASSRDDGRQFANEMRMTGADFRSFVQDDDTVLDAFCWWVGRKLNGSFDVTNVAILSEDETAYGNMVTKESGSSRSATRRDDKRPNTHNCPSVTKLYYPRDISTLRAAYQSQSMFNTATTQQSPDNAQRKSLPTDLADPGGEQHDTVRTYAGNQTPLSQEAQLLGIVEALRAHGAEYVVLRSSNTLDPLFLANFLRRDYPVARVVIQNSDLLFQRGQDAMALSGAMTLSTYPLFSWARDWTELPPYDAHSHRVFPENSTEGTYIASRLLLQTQARARGETPSLNCEFSDQEVFAPSLRCEPDGAKPYAPLPDYSPPYWMEAKPCDPNSTQQRCRPAAWLSVITRNGTWPLAALNDRTLPPHPEDPSTMESVGTDGAGTNVQAVNPSSSERPKWPGITRSTQALLIALCGFALFHALCCWYASFTAKPAFRAHFATAGRRHTGLVLIGSYLIAQMALLTGWGCGIFAEGASPVTSSKVVWVVVVFVCGVSGLGMVANIFATRRLNGYAGRVMARSAWRVGFSLALFGILLWAFFRTWVHPLEGVLVLATRAFVYYRSMHLSSAAQQIALRRSPANQYPVAALKQRIALVHPLAHAAGLLSIFRNFIGSFYRSRILYAFFMTKMMQSLEQPAGVKDA